MRRFQTSCCCCAMDDRLPSSSIQCLRLHLHLLHLLLDETRMGKRHSRCSREVKGLTWPCIRLSCNKVRVVLSKSVYMYLVIPFLRLVQPARDTHALLCFACGVAWLCWVFESRNREVFRGCVYCTLLMMAVTAVTTTRQCPHSLSSSLLFFLQPVTLSDMCRVSLLLSGRRARNAQLLACSVLIKWRRGGRVR